MITGHRERKDLAVPGLHVSPHPLVAHHVVALRDPATQPPAFRRVVRQLTRLLAVEATASLTTTEVQAVTPLGAARGRRIAERIAIVPILRAGLGMADGLLELIPDAEVWHIGLYRDEATLQPQEYYNKLPRSCAANLAVVVDPMLATGGSAVRTCEILRGAGIQRIVFVALIASPEGVACLQQAMPDVAIHVAALDEGLNDVGYIVPGLGDAGDRQFGTAQH
ncbi:MAG: uracil phosphoribosyltransferase [Planctomycetia bacterium]|nr:uracil phosphoribosyltransferase [Planctomycetia bacterium]